MEGDQYGASDNQGTAFASLLDTLFGRVGLRPQLAYSPSLGAVEGTFDLDGDSCLLHGYWVNGPIGRDAAIAFGAAGQNRSRDTPRVLLSVNGFTEEALSTSVVSTPFMTMDMSDLAFVLEGRIALIDLLEAKKRYASQGERYMPARRVVSDEAPLS